MAYSSASSFSAPFFVGCLFPEDEEFEDEIRAAQAQFKQPGEQSDVAEADKPNYNQSLLYETLRFQFVDRVMELRQFDDHFRNANSVWPESSFLAEFFCGIPADAHQEPVILDKTNNAPSVNNHSVIQSINKAVVDESKLRSLLIGPDPAHPYRVLELGSATGALSIFLRLHDVDVTSSDIDDAVVTENIAHNCALNNLSVQHLAHTWGSKLDELRSKCDADGHFDVILGSDLLAYEDSFSDLANTLECLMQPKTVMYMCWKRRQHSKGGGISPFFTLMESRGFTVTRLPSGMYSLCRSQQSTDS